MPQIDVIKYMRKLECPNTTKYIERHFDDPFRKRLTFGGPFLANVEVDHIFNVINANRAAFAVVQPSAIVPWATENGYYRPGIRVFTQMRAAQRAQNRAPTTAGNLPVDYTCTICGEE